MQPRPNALTQNPWLTKLTLLHSTRLPMCFMDCITYLPLYLYPVAGTSYMSLGCAMDSTFTNWKGLTALRTTSRKSATCKDKNSVLKKTIV